MFKIQVLRSSNSCFCKTWTTCQPALMQHSALQLSHNKPHGSQTCLMALEVQWKVLPPQPLPLTGPISTIPRQNTLVLTTPTLILTLIPAQELSFTQELAKKSWLVLAISSEINNMISVPLSFLSGTFYSVNSLPKLLKNISEINPFFYIIDGFRYGFLGVSDGSIKFGLFYLIVLSCLTWLVAYILFKKGYKNFDWMIQVVPKFNPIKKNRVLPEYHFKNTNGTKLVK